MPLVGIYLAILYPYAAKIAITRAWPDGWVAWPVIGLAVIGLLALLLVQPLALAGLRWAEWFAGRWFGRLLVPMAVLLGAAVCVRVGEYGLTESRYAGLVLAAWLAVCGLYFGTGAMERRSLKVIPCSLLVLCAALAAGPWGLFAVAERSQLARLERVLAKHALIADGVVQAREQTLTLALKDYEDLRSMIDYLHRRHRSEDLYSLMQPWLKDHPESRDNHWGFGSTVLNWLKVERADDDNRIGISWTARDMPLEGFARASFVDLRYHHTLDGAEGMRLRLGENRDGIEMEVEGVWKPIDALNAQIKERAVTKPEWGKASAALWTDITLPSGETLRIVILRVEGNLARVSKKHEFWSIDVLVLAR